MAKKKGKVELIEKTLDHEIEAEVVKGESHSPDDQGKVVPPPEEHSQAAQRPETQKQSFSKLNFFGRSYLENRFPQSMTWADRFAHDWKEEGSFEFIEMPHPLAKDLLISGIKNFRLVEKRVENTIQDKIIPLAEVAKQKVEKAIQTIRS